MTLEEETAAIEWTVQFMRTEVDWHLKRTREELRLDFILPHLATFFRAGIQHADSLLARCKELSAATGVSAADSARIGTDLARMVFNVTEMMARLMVIIEVVAEQAKMRARTEEQPPPFICAICGRTSEDEPSFVKGKHGRGICRTCAVMACAHLGIEVRPPSCEIKKD